jgi:hypothetical protein
MLQLQDIAFTQTTCFVHVCVLDILLLLLDFLVVWCP